MRHWVVLTILLGVVSQASLAQQSSDEVDIMTPDLKKLEWLTFERVNGLRNDRGLQNLVWDEVLYRAAKDHAEFLIREKRISHFQKTKGKETVAARVKLHGGFIYTNAGENIVLIQLGVQYPVKGQKLSTVTYGSSANVMTDLWKNSPGHYRNIISDKYSCTALAVSYDSNNQHLIAVQVFAFTPTPSVSEELPDYSEHLLESRIPDLPFGLKESKGLKDRKTMRDFMKLEMDRGYLTGSFRTAKKVFKGRRSGIVQEFIPLSQFDSASKEFTQVPNRRNGLYELNGTLTKPAYRKEMLRYSRKNTNRDYIVRLPILKIKKRTRQFLFPLHEHTNEMAFNLFLIRQKRLQIYRTYNMVPWRFFDIEFPQLEFKTSFKAKEKNERYKVTYQYDTLLLQVFYPSQIVTIDQQRQREIETTFSDIHGKIVKVDAEAFTSVDGDQVENDRLARERMHNFMLLVNPFLDTTDVIPHIVMREQWDLFQKQIDEHNLAALGNMSLQARRLYVNENRKDSLISKLLDRQRYTRIKIVLRKELLEVIPGKSALQEYETLRVSFQSSMKPTSTLVQRLEQAQLAVYYELEHGDAPAEALPIPLLERYPVFQYHDLLFRYIVLQRVSDKDFYDQLHALTKSKYFPAALKSQAVYNNHVLIYRNYSHGTLDSLLEDPEWGCRDYMQSEFHLKKVKKIRCKRKSDFTGLKELMLPVDYFVLREIPIVIRNGQQQKINVFPVEDLWRYYYLYTIQSLHINIPLPSEIFGFLPKFKEYFHPNDEQLTDEERVKLALFYCAMQRYKIALNLLKPSATRNDPNKQALRIYLALIFSDFKDQHEFAERLIQEFPRLGKDEWCSLWGDREYLNFLLLEDLKLKKFYNCNCKNASQ